MFKMSNELYDILKEIALTILPALAVFYTACSKIWGLPFGAEIPATIMAVDALVLVQHSRQVHLLIVLVQNGMKRLKALNRRLVVGNAHHIKAGHQSRSVHITFSSQYFTQLSPSRK